MLRLLIFSSFTVVLSACSSGSGDQVFTSKAELGDALYSDKNLSLNRTQSCATCHSTNHAFIDNRLDSNDGIGAVSVGDNGFSLGDRNTPTAGYARFSPDFHIGSRTRPNVKQSKFDTYNGAIGGQFLDGRERDLAGQAGVPPLNPVEMGMVDKASVVARIRENNTYIEAFKSLFGDAVFEHTETAYTAMAESIAEFEKTKQFSPFDSKYDRSIADFSVLSSKESAGKALFFSTNLNCSICHQLHDQFDLANRDQETFTTYEYHNIGVPENSSVRLRNGAGVDNGLFNNTNVNADKGKFKTPTLRNVAVTEPYMHNGVFRNLATVIEFYNHIDNRDNTNHQNNPETSGNFGAAEVVDNIANDELSSGKILSPEEIENMVCFLRTLTDAKYEPLIQEKGISC